MVQLRRFWGIELFKWVSKTVGSGPVRKGGLSDKLHTRFDAAFKLCFEMQLVRRVASSPCSQRDFHSLCCLEPQHQPRSILALFVGPQATCSSPCGLAAVVTFNRRLRLKTVAMATIPGPGRRVASVRSPMTSSSRTPEAEVARSPSTGRTA